MTPAPVPTAPRSSGFVPDGRLAGAIPPSPISFPGLEDLKDSLLADGHRACDEAADVLLVLT
jgi:hypothetical protein